MGLSGVLAVVGVLLRQHAGVRFPGQVLLVNPGDVAVFFSGRLVQMEQVWLLASTSRRFGLSLS